MPRFAVLSVSASSFSSIPAAANSSTDCNPPAAARPVAYSPASPIERATTCCVEHLKLMGCCPCCSNALDVLLRVFRACPVWVSVHHVFPKHILRLIKPFDFAVCHQEHGQAHHSHPVELRGLSRSTPHRFRRILAVDETSIPVTLTPTVI